MTNCTNCNQQLKPNENYCPNCGNPVKLKRIDKHYVSHEIIHLLHFEKGFLYTIKGLTTRPGEAVREFISENRTKHMKPIAFLILTSLLFTLVAHFFHADKIVNEKEKLMFADSSIGAIMNWVQTNYGYSNIIMGGSIALCVKLLFRKYQYNFYEISVLLCFIMGQGMLLLTIQTFFLPLISNGTYQLILTIVAFSYPTWAIGQFFDRKKVTSYLKAFVAYLLGYIFFYIAVILVGITADVIIKLMVH